MVSSSDSKVTARQLNSSLSALISLPCVRKLRTRLCSDIQALKAKVPTARMPAETLGRLAMRKYVVRCIDHEISLAIGNGKGCEKSTGD